YILTYNMKLVLLLFCFVPLVLAEDQYDSSNDNINLAEVLGNDRLIASYSKCLLNEGPCTPEVKKLKEKLPEALETRCAKCTEKQKQMGRQLVKEVKEKHPGIWKELVAYYDPQG
ncbi:A10/OS-D family protein, partial [Bacillus amyloliquefaciens]|uniref:A10/OS-D family protein n=1 Tax=Bacillus amyloliquefaciens TaxID=1390 RepID=UPI002119D7BA